MIDRARELQGSSSVSTPDHSTGRASNRPPRSSDAGRRGGLARSGRAPDAGVSLGIVLTGRVELRCIGEADETL